MNRRKFNKTLGALLAASVVPVRASATAETQAAPSPSSIQGAVPSGSPQHIAMLVHPGFIPLDLFGPQAVFAMLGNVHVHLVWKTKEVISAAGNVAIQPTTTLKECPSDLEILFVPGGLEGGTPLFNDPEVTEFLHDRGQRAKYVTSVCTGSLLLGAAGLLQGYKATSHWTVRDLLSLFGAEPVTQRVVEDRNRITAGGVTAGIDFGLQVAARLRGEEYAKMLQLLLEYDPQPPFHAGNPESAGVEAAHQVRTRRAPAVEAARQAALLAQKRLHT